MIGHVRRNYVAAIAAWYPHHALACVRVVKAPSIKLNAKGTFDEFLICLPPLFLGGSGVYSIRYFFPT